MFLNLSIPKDHLFKRNILHLKIMNPQDLVLTIDTQNIFFTADLHLNDTKVLKYPNNKFKSIEDRNRAVIESINNKVKKDDLLFLLGDIGKGLYQEHIKSINCKNLILVLGNHDMKINEEQKSYYKKISPYLVLMVKDSENFFGWQKIILFHFPLNRWTSDVDGSWMLHGHTHGFEAISDYKIQDVGIDSSQFTINSYKELKELFQERKNKTY